MEIETPQLSEKALTLPYYSEPSFTPHWLSPDSAELTGLHDIPSFNLTNQHGEALTSDALKGKIYIVNFFFTSCPGICPQIIENMQAVKDAFIEDANLALLSFSVTPDTDNVGTLQNYAKVNGVDSQNWHLLTGDRKKIYHLGRKGYFIEEDLGVEKSNDEFLHTENLVLVDGNQHIRGIYNGINRTSVRQLITDIKTLKKESKD